MTTSPQTRRRLFLAALVLATAATWANAFPPIFAGLDAKESIRDNRYIRDLWPPSHAMSLPLLEDAIAIDPGSKGGTMVRRPVLSVTQAVFGTEPWGYHLINNVIHLTAVLVLFGLLRRTFASAGVERGDAIAFAVALLWMFYLLTLYGAARAPGLGTKETMVTAPVAVLLYDWVFVSRSAHARTSGTGTTTASSTGFIPLTRCRR